MIKTKPATVAADRLKSFIERIEKMEEERRAVGGDIRDIYSEAKGVGYDVKTMRRIVQLRKQDAADRDEAEALLDTYAHALGMVIGGVGLGSVTVEREPTEDELMERAGKVLGEVDRCMALSVDGKAPKIADIQDLIGCSLGKASKLRHLVVERLDAWISFSPSNDSTVKSENEKPLTPTHEMGAERSEHATIPTREGERDDGLDIPTFLRCDVARKSSHPDEREERAAQ